MKNLILAVLIFFPAAGVQAATPLHDQVVSKLKGKTSLPATFPSWLPSEFRAAYAHVYAKTHSYSVQLTWDASDNNSMANNAGSLTADDQTSLAQELKTSNQKQSLPQYIHTKYEGFGSVVTLRPGLKGHYSAPTGSSDGGSTSLTWEDGGVYYFYQLRGAVPEDAMVKSALSETR